MLRLWRMHGELVPVELETGMLEVRKMMGTTGMQNMIYAIYE